MTRKVETVLVTGGAGFIGSRTVAQLIREGFRVRVLDNLSSGKLENLGDDLSRVEFVEADLRSIQPADVEDVDAVIHLAALVSVQESLRHPDRVFHENIHNTFLLAEACRQSRVKNLVFASSAAIYGDQKGGVFPIPENAEKKPVSLYGASKLSGESMLFSYAQSFGFRVTVLRYFNVYGPNQPADSPYSGVISLFFDRISRHQPVHIFGSGEQTRDFIHIEDVVRANVLACTNKGSEKFQVLNVGTGREISLNTLIHDISGTTGHVPELVHAPPRTGDIKRSVASVTKTRDVLGWHAEIDLPSGLEGYLAHSSNP